MSLYERHPFDHKEKMMGNHQAPNSNHSIWTYTFPIVAFHHPALLQSMLAIGSLQIARLKALPPTAAMKHYHLAIRRIARNVRSHTKRTQPATLASTLLLAFFEPQSDGRFESTLHKRTASGNPRPSSRTHEDRRIEERRTERTFVTQLERLTQRTRSPQRAERSPITSAKAKAPETHKTSESQQKEARVEPPGMLRILRSDRVPPD
ncbi:hypothetical protein BN1723_003273 [Verticillium longisporum]|uniref:Uncharacterized protein n=1 Tax=Verticillium longisporum TaxID=100787 RepID=A0A0G4LTR0_VERLO|nr:hypothetical protein BN1723_003273 [Verticillium longisporum]